LAVIEHKEKRLRKTKAAAKAVAAEEQFEIPEDLELTPSTNHHKELADARRELLIGFQDRAVKSIVVDLNAVAAKYHKVDDPKGYSLKKAQLTCGGSLLRKVRSVIAPRGRQIDLIFV